MTRRSPATSAVVRIFCVHFPSRRPSRLIAEGDDQGPREEGGGALPREKSWDA